MRRWVALAAWIVALALALPSLAAAALPPEIARRIAEAAGTRPEPYHATLAEALGNPQLAGAASRAAAERRRAALAAAVVEAIAAQPALAGEVVAAAAHAAPDLAPAIAAEAKRAFPGFAAAIDGALAGRGGVTTADGAPADGLRTAQLLPPEPRPTAPPPEPPTPEQRDPWEGVNRAIFAVNDTLDVYLIKPVAQGYGTVMPEGAKRAVRRFFTNLGAPAVLANDLLQLEFAAATTTTGRFLVNTTVGLAGLFDPASALGLDGHPADFDQTLHTWGIGSGPYLMLPVLGPATVRHAIGRGVDGLFDPLSWLLDPLPRVGVAVADGITRRERVIEPLDELRETSIDYYAAIRSLYFQDRETVLRRGREPAASELDVLFESVE